MSNLRLALRMLFRTPALSAIAVLSLAIGIGANAAIFSLYNQMLLRPLPVRDPAGLVNLGAPGPKPGSQSSNQAGSSETTFSYLMFRDLEKAQTRFSGVAAHRILEANVGFKAQTTTGPGMLVSGSYFGVLGLTPAAGRLIGIDDDRTPGAHEVVVLSHGYWQTRFAMSPAVIGDALIINGVSMTVIGVAPQGFTGTTLGALPNVFVPLSMRERLLAGWKGLDNRRNYWAYVFARLQPGATIESAQAAVNVPYRAIINDLEAGLQEGHEPGDDDPVPGQAGDRRSRRAGPEPPDGQRAQPAVPAAGGDGVRPPHRLRQHRQPAARARCGACERDGGAPVDRGQPVAGGTAAPHRVGGARGARGRLRPAGGPGHAQRHHRHGAGAGHVVPEQPDRPVDAGVLRRRGHRDRAPVRPLSGAAQHAARSGDRNQEHGRPAVRRARRLALPHRPRDDADRALDDAADPGRALHEEPREHHARRPWHPDREARHLRPRPGSERLLAGAIEGALRTGGGRARRGARRQRRRRRHRPAPGRQQLGQRRDGHRDDVRPGRRHRLDVQRGQPRLLRDRRHAAPGRARLHARRHPGRPEGRHHQRGVRAEVQDHGPGNRVAHDERDRRQRQARHRDRRPREGRQVQRSQARDPAGVLHAVSPGRQRSAASRSTPGPGSPRTSCSRRSPASSPAWTRISRSRISRRWRPRCGRTSASTG